MQCSSRKGRESASLKAETARLRGQNRCQGGEGGAKARDNKACAKATDPNEMDIDGRDRPAGMEMDV